MPFFPKTNEDVSQFLRSRSKSSLHITGGAHDHPRAETISLSQLKKGLVYEPEEMIISVQAGITLVELQQILKENGQWIPTLVAEESLQLTLGAAIAMDHYHPRAKNCGMLRTTILGGTFCATNGEIFKSGSRVVKSVAGYDIHRAFCGSRGRFGVILDLTLKVQPMPEMFYHFFAPIETGETLLRYHPTCIEESRGKLLVEFAGYKEDVLVDVENLTLGNFTVQELDEEKWNYEIKNVIPLRDKGKAKILSPEVEFLLHNVRKVFDPDGILTKFDFSPINSEVADKPVNDFPLRVFPMRK